MMMAPATDQRRRVTTSAVEAVDRGVATGRYLPAADIVGVYNVHRATRHSGATPVDTAREVLRYCPEHLMSRRAAARRSWLTVAARCARRVPAALREHLVWLAWRPREWWYARRDGRSTAPGLPAPGFGPALAAAIQAVVSVAMWAAASQRWPRWAAHRASHR